MEGSCSNLLCSVGNVDKRSARLIQHNTHHHPSMWDVDQSACLASESPGNVDDF